MPAKTNEKLAQIIAEKSISTITQQVRTLSKAVGSKVNAGLQFGFLMDSIAENHERYTNWEYKYKADTMTGISIGAGASASALAGPVVGVGAGILTSSGANSYIEREKIEMEKQDKEETKKRGDSK